MTARKNIVTIAVACLGSLAILAGTLFFIWTQSPIDPTDLIPADRTVAYFSNVRRENMMSWNRVYPILSNIPFVDGTFSLALINEKGAFQWMMFSNAHADPASQRGVVYGSLRIEDSYGEGNPAKRIEMSKADPFSHSTVFRTLQANSPKTKTWAFADLAGVMPQSPTPLDRYLLAMTKDHPQLMVGMDGNRWSVSMVSATDMPSVASLQLPHGQYPFSVTLAHPSESIGLLMKGFLPAEQDIARSFAQGFVSDLIAKTVTLTRDLGALFQEPVTLSLEPQANGASFLLEGRMNEEETLAKTLAAVYEKSKTSASAVSVTKRQFDAQFGTTVVERVTGSGTLATAQMNGWSVRSTSADNGKTGFVVAQKGNMFLLGNSPGWAFDRMSATQRAPAGGFGVGLSDSDLLAAGHTDADTVRWFLAQMPMIQLESSLFPSINTFKGPMDWSVVRRGNVVTLSVQRN